VQCLFAVVATGIGAARAGSIGRQQGDRYVVGLSDVFEIGSQVGKIGSVVFQQSETLASASQGGASGIGRAHIAAQERRRRTRSSGRVRDNGLRIDAVSLCVVNLINHQRTRYGVVVQSGDVPQV